MVCDRPNIFVTESDVVALFGRVKLGGGIANLSSALFTVPGIRQRQRYVRLKYEEN